MMETQVNRRFGALAICISTAAGCGMMGDTASIKSATALAVECKTDAALAALDRADQSGGIATYLSGLERVGILRDVGRTGEAEAAMEAYLSRPEADSSSPQEINQSIDEFISELRAERLKQTGNATCADE